MCIIKIKIERLILIAFAGIFLLSNTACRRESLTEIAESEVLEIPFKKEGEIELYHGDSLIQKLNIEVADTEGERRQGLMWRSKMEDNYAMLFIHPDEEVGALSYWMKNTRIPLDIIYISPDSTVVSIAKNARPGQQLGVPSAEGDAKYVLEVNGGLSDKWGIYPGKTKLRWNID